MRRPRARRGDDTDRPCQRDDFRRIVTPLYPAEDRHETVRPNSQNILLFRSDFIQFSFPCFAATPSPSPVHIHNCEPHPAHSCVQVHGSHLEKWRREQGGPTASPAVHANASCRPRAPLCSDDDGPQPQRGCGPSYGTDKGTGPGEVSARARRPVRRRRHD